jgi:hypothetical protein
LESDFFGPFVSKTVESHTVPVETNFVATSTTSTVANKDLQQQQQTDMLSTANNDLIDTLTKPSDQDVKSNQNKNFMNKDSILALYNNSSQPAQATAQQSMLKKITYESFFSGDPLFEHFIVC